MLNFLTKTGEAIRKIVPKTSSIAPEILEEALIESDMAYEEIEALLERIVTPITRDRLDFALLELLPFFEPRDLSTEIVGKKPFVELVIGINGAGKTTTIAKLASLYKSAGQSVILGAGDTFRAAAVEQLKIWADKLSVPIVLANKGGDPSAVAYDAITSARSRGVDRVLIDTAGRLHTQKNLGEELKKIARVCSKALDGAPHRKILVLDGSQGRSAIAQAREFHEIVGIDALIVTKLDGTAKGGAIYSISRELQAPILYLGAGEGVSDLAPFEPKEFTADFVGAFFEG
ncbi:MAG: signal recognition particle-docking protein FtsY [Helicobacteraceae bacterium]|jgi:fused signal recognition particle receptor|nr:signal recognition particle-docking protein FtsY [Helicobacteraceae bacterium]